MQSELRVHPSSFYAWVNEPLRQPALDDQRQTGLVKKAWKDSGKVYGHRNIQDDLIDMARRSQRTALPVWPALQAFKPDAQAVGRSAPQT